MRKDLGVAELEERKSFPVTDRGVHGIMPWMVHHGVGVVRFKNTKVRVVKSGGQSREVRGSES